MFQHVALRDAAFENHPELVRELSGQPGVPPLLHFWSRAELLCRRQGLHPLRGPAGEVLDPEAAEDAAMDLQDAVSIQSRQGDGFTAHVVRMPDPVESPEAHLVAVVHRDNEAHDHARPSASTRYFTLERAPAAGGPPLLCEWLVDGTHANYGEGPEPDVAAFAEVVFDRL